MTFCSESLLGQLVKHEFRRENNIDEVGYETCIQLHPNPHLKPDMNNILLRIS